MLEFTAPDVPPPPAHPDDPRLGTLVGRRVAAGEPPALVIVGFPSDEGVRRNGGRVGAAGAPDKIRRILYRMTPDVERPAPFAAVVERTADLGNLVVHDEVEKDQELLAEAIAPYLAQDTVVLVLGGGHETTYGHFRGYVRAERDVRLVNLDAHPDVRAVGQAGAHSGSPFRQALEDASGRCAGYAVAGLRPWCVAASHLEFLKANGAQVTWGRDLDAAAAARLYEGSGPTLASFDMDAVCAAHAPGVSAPTPDGLSPGVWLAAAEAAGRSPAVTSLDLVEVNPTVDTDQRTARLAALTVWMMLRGLAERLG